VLRRPRFAPLLAVALVGALASGAVAAPSAPTTAPAPAPRIPDPYYPADGNVGYDVRHYDVHDTYRFSDRHLSGVTTIRLVPQQELTTFGLDLLLTVDAVRVDGAVADFEKPNGHKLVVTPSTALAQGEPVDVRVRYHGFPARVSSPYAGEHWLAGRREVVTMGEPHMAAWWFPSNDHPSDKARFDIRITTGKGRDVISNGVRVGRTVRQRSATTHWRMTDPMATYLAFFAAGDFAIERGRAHGLRYYNAVSERLGAFSRASSMRVLRQSAEITAWLAREVGDYPFATTGGLVTSLPVGFALENQSRPTYPSNPGRVTVVHELAHQWFGDAVSVARWRDIWLNEGFATYLEHRYDEAHGRGTTSRWLHSAYRNVNPESWDFVIADPCAEATPCPWWMLFDSRVYQRGGMTLAALRNRIGKADFHRLLRRWVVLHSGGSATSEQFERLAERVSGEQLDAFFQAWLRDTSRPPNTADYGL
jgi:aminopeptidase N